MTLIRRPTDHYVPLSRVLDQLFNDWPFATREGMIAAEPALDVRDADDAYIIEAEAPGVNPDDTEVLVEGRTVTIRGQIGGESEQRNGDYLVRERRRGQFLRSVTLPGMVDIDRVSSRYENGELVITLPKAAENRARRVEIRSGIGAGSSQGATSPSSPSSESGSGA